MASVATQSKRSTPKMKKTPREQLQALRERAGLTQIEVSRQATPPFKSSSGYARYEMYYEDKPIPYHIVKRLLPVLVGRGSPKITADDLIALSDVRPSDLDRTALNPTGAPPLSGNLVPLASGRPLPMRYRIERGVYLDEDEVGKRVFGPSPFLASLEYPEGQQFGALVADGSAHVWFPQGTVLHCVAAGEFPSRLPLGKKVVVTVARANTGLHQALVVTVTEDGLSDALGAEIDGTVVGVVVWAYIRQ